MCWTALSAIGTVIAAFVGIAGIWVNLCDKKKKMKVFFENGSTFYIYISNGSLRSLAVTKMVCSVNKHIFYVKSFEGLSVIQVSPAHMETIELIKNVIYDEYHKCRLNDIYSPNDEIVIVLYDNLGRKYKIKTGLGIVEFKSN